MARSMENLTSSAVSALPSLNFTPSRSVNCMCVGLTCFQAVASMGSILKLLLL